MTSRKLIIFLLASMVMRNPLLSKMRHISFLMFSVSSHRTRRTTAQAKDVTSASKKNS